MGLLVEVLVQLQHLVHIIPDPHRLVKAAGCHQRLADARVHPGHLPGVQRRGKIIKVPVVRLHDVRVGEREREELVVFGRANELLLRVREGEVPDFDGVAVDREHLGALVQVLFVRFFVNRNGAVVAAGDQALGEAHDGLNGVGV